MRIDRSAFRRNKIDKDSEVIQIIQKIAYRRKRWGYRQICFEMRKKLIINHKKVYRIYSELGLKIRMKRVKRKRVQASIKVTIPQNPNEIWAMDFMHDSLRSGKKIRLLNIIDIYSRECITSRVEYSINSYRLLNILNELKEERILPKSIIVDNGPEFTSKAFLDWALRNNIDIHFISKGKPTENGYIESFNGKLRNECLNEHWFNDIEESREILSEWIDHYNNERPYSSLKGLSPMEYLKNVA